MRATVIRPRLPFVDIHELAYRLSEAVYSACKEGHAYIAQYPPEPWWSEYERTHKLGQSWSVAVSPTSSRIEGIVGSSSAEAPYNIWVQGPFQKGGLGQTGSHHATGWRSVDQMADVMAARLADELRAIFPDAR